MPGRCASKADACVRRVTMAAVTFLLVLLPSSSLPAAAFKIAPGPLTMSEEEKSIAADLERGIQHGVILIEESERDDPFSGYAKTSFHLRAKILSLEARALGDIELPFDANTGYLPEWWGRTICPDGTVHDLAKDDLRRETVVKSGGLKLQVLKGALAGIEPGCVIDYGWVIRDRSFTWRRRIPLQRPWPIRELRYHWLPAPDMPSQYALRRTPGLEVLALPSSGASGSVSASGPRVRLSRDKDSVLIEGWDLPAAVEEPYGPPDDLVRASVLLHYVSLGSNENVDTFWEEHSRDHESRVREFLFHDKGLKEALASMEIAPEAPLAEKLTLVHDWLAVHIRNLSRLTSEESEAKTDREDLLDWDARRVLEGGEGHSWNIDYLFIGFARALGADARIVLAPDRTDSQWDRSLLTTSQLSERAVAVRDPGDPARKITFTDPCSGLPYGMVPWWLAPSKGMLTGREGFEEVVLPVSDPRQNILHSQTNIAWDEEGRPLVRWSSVGGGQRGFTTRRALRGMNPEERKERIEQLCGAGSSFELSLAEAPAWDQLHADFQINCEGVMTGFTADLAGEEIAFPPAGGWFPALPAFTSETRVHPVVFNYPFIDMSVIDVSVPEGFEMGDLPAPLKLGTPFTSYALSVTKEGAGVRLQRAFAVMKTAVAATEYGTLRKFLQEVENADRLKLVFRRPEDRS